MHRNTFVFMILLAVVAALLVGVNIGRRLSTQPTADSRQLTAATPSPAPRTLLIPYTNTRCGISFQYPEHLTKLEATAGAMFIDPQSASNSVALTCQANIPRPPLSPEKTEAVTLEATSGASISATLYHDTSTKDGTPVDKLIFTHPKSGLDIFLAGFGETLKQILPTLKILF